MLTDLFYKLRAVQIPVSITEYLTLLEALEARVASLSVDDFYYLSRAALIKDERFFDRFDLVFSSYMEGTEAVFEELLAEIPAEWLAHAAELELSDEERAQIESMGGLEALMEALRERLAEQKEAHRGGNRMIGTGGTSPFGAYGYNPEGMRMGQDESRHQRAIKVWDRRDFANLDDHVELGTRNIKMALRQLRRFAREGAAEQLDLDETISATARKGYLDINMVPERRNTMKVLLLMDVGGSMDPYVKVCEELFSAARSEFQHLEFYYFHNFVYETLWRDNRMRYTQRTPTYEVINTFGSDYRLVFVGDATMSPYEITSPGGSVEHYNEEAGALWIQRLLAHWPHAVWLNPQPEDRWSYIASLQIVEQLMADRMFPLTIEGLGRAIDALKRPH